MDFNFSELFKSLERLAKELIGLYLIKVYPLVSKTCYPQINQSADWDIERFGVKHCSCDFTINKRLRSYYTAICGLAI